MLWPSRLRLSLGPSQSEEEQRQQNISAPASGEAPESGSDSSGDVQ